MGRPLPRERARHARRDRALVDPINLAQRAQSDRATTSMKVSPQSQANRLSSRLLKRWCGTMQTKRIDVAHCGQSGGRSRNW
jgi:hypothetical protein